MQSGNDRENDSFEARANRFRYSIAEGLNLIADMLEVINDTEIDAKRHDREIRELKLKYFKATGERLS